MVVNHKPKITFLTYLGIGLMVAALGTYIRLYPLLNFTTHDISEKTTLLVLTQIRAQINQQVQQNYPQAPADKKAVIAKKLFDDVIRAKGKQLRKAIDQTSLKIQKQAEAGPQHPYLLASDSFYYYKLTQNIIDQGHISDTVKGSKYLNELMLAPHGHWEPFNWHPYIGYFIYQCQKIFNPDIDLMYAISFTAMVIAIISLIPFLWICHRLRLSPLTAFISSVFYVLAPIFVKRSMFGWYDNDPYSALFPLCILACFFQGLHYLKTRDPHPHKPLVAGVLTALGITLYSLFWQGWVFMFGVILVSGLIIFFHHLFTQRRSDTKRPLGWFLLSICLGGFVFVSIAFGINEFFTLFAEGGKALKDFIAPQLSLWPDIYISVSELHNASWGYILKHTGGILFFCVALVGLTRNLLQWRKGPRQGLFYETIILGVFLLFALMITFGAQRFVLLCVIPLSLLFALGIQFFLDHLFTFVNHRWRRRSRKVAQGMIAIAFLMLTALPITHIQANIQSLLNPIYNDTWHTVLTEIRDRTPPNSIINTWWPPGHFIKAVAHRAVTFDGATINYPQAYWMANVFLSNTEEAALGLLRMLNHSGNDAVHYLHDELGMPLSLSVQILKEITPLSRSRAKTLLCKGLDEVQAEQLLALTHGDPPPSYCLIYKEFVDANLQLGFFGKWNFQTIEKINRNPELMQKIPDRHSEEYIDFLWTLVGGPLKYSGSLALINQDKEQLLFQDNVVVNTQTMGCTVNSDQYGQGVPQNLFYMRDGTFTEKEFADANLPYSVVLYKQGKKHQVILCDERLARSLLVRLYFFEGQGLRYFEGFTKDSDLTGRTKIYVYRVLWDTFIHRR
jgi:dolichyl-diphosphooligosaccharide--protein glycosyltransferase